MKKGYRKETHKRIISLTLDEEIILFIQTEAERNGMNTSLYVNTHFKEKKNDKLRF